jgi:hypothetical protein
MSNGWMGEGMDEFPKRMGVGAYGRERMPTHRDVVTSTAAEGKNVKVSIWNFV